MASSASVVLTRQLLQKWVDSPAMRRDFPFLATAYLSQQSATKTGCCSRKKAAKNDLLKPLFCTVANLPGDQKAKLKKIANVGQLEVKCGTKTVTF